MAKTRKNEATEQNGKNPMLMQNIRKKRRVEAKEIVISEKG